jgi:hypothetical protein
MVDFRGDEDVIAVCLELDVSERAWQPAFKS